MRATVLLNRGGGAVQQGDEASENIVATLGECGIEASAILVSGDEVEPQCRAAASRGDPLLIVAGGDGTVSAAAGALAGTGTALGIIPMGTLNHFARDLAIPLDVNQAALTIARGHERTIDIAEMNGRPFVNNVAIGLYPLMVLDRDMQRDRLGRSKRLAMIVASLRTLVRFKHQRLTLTVNDEKSRVDTPLLFVGNNDYQLELPGAGQRSSLDDGRLCAFVMRSRTRAGFLAAVARALAGRPREDDMVRLDDIERLRVESRRSWLTIAVDGEVVRLKPPLDFRVRQGALKVIAPAD